jgi:ssDNA-binding Zn-finger/Zn-ribbon topoisomerase 1
VEQKKIEFKVKKGKLWGNPRWQKVESENAECPQCGHKMMVVTGKNINVIVHDASVTI